MDEREVRRLLSNAAEAIEPRADLAARAERRYRRRRARARAVVGIVVVVLVGSGIATAAVVGRGHTPAASKRPARPIPELVNPNSLTSLSFAGVTTGYAVANEGEPVLVETVDGGRTWTAIAAMPAGAAHVEYAGYRRSASDLVAWGARGLYTSADAGSHWRQTLPGPVGAVAASSPRIWATVTCSGPRACSTRVATSDDGGNTWRDTSLHPTGIGALAIATISSDTAYVVEHAAPSRWEVAFTTDGGKGWTHAPTPCIYNVYGGVVSGGPPRLAVGDGGHSFMLACYDGATQHVYVSSDGARNWNPVAPLPGSSPVLALSAIGDSEFFVGLGGAWTKGPLLGPVLDQWQWHVVQQPFGTVQAIDVVPGAGVYFATNASGVWFRADHGATWERRAAAPPASPITTPGSVGVSSGPVDPSAIADLSFVNADLGFGIVGRGVVRTDDGGRSWRRVGALDRALQDVGGGAPAPGLHFADAANGVAWGGGALEVTADGGTTWALPSDAVLSENEVAWAGGRLWSFNPCLTAEQCDPLPLEISDDAGKTWRLTAPVRRGLGGPDLLVVSRTTAYIAEPVANRSVNQGGPWQLAVTNDGGASWTYQPAPCPTFTENPSLAFNGRVLLLSCIGEPAGDTTMIEIFTSADGGARWTARGRAGGQSALVTSVGTTFVLQTGRSGLEASTDDGRSWPHRAFSDDYGPGLSASVQGVGIWGVIFNGSPSRNGIWFSADGVHWEKRA